MCRVETRRIFFRVESFPFGAGGNCSGTSSGNLFLVPGGNQFHAARLREFDRGVADGKSLAHGDELEHVAALLALEAVEESLARRDDECAIIGGLAEMTSTAPRIPVLFERSVPSSGSRDRRLPLPSLAGNLPFA